MDHSPPSKPVIVGIDGSTAALRAALWAVDEAVSRDIPLRLVYAVDPGEDNDVHPDDAARTLATAEIAVRSAIMAVESTNKPVKIEVEITQGHPTSTLVQASRSAVMACVGAVGLNHFQRGRVGSTAAAVASSAHCPVAIIRGQDGAARRPAFPRTVGPMDRSVDPAQTRPPRYRRPIGLDRDGAALSGWVRVRPRLPRARGTPWPARVTAVHSHRRRVQTR